MVNEKIQKSLRKRYRKEKMFKFSGLLAIIVTVSFLFILFSAIIYRGTPAFIASQIALDVDLTSVNAEDIDYRQVMGNALNAKFPVAEENDRANNFLLSKTSHLELRKQIENNPNLIGSKTKLWFSTSSDVDMFVKGKISEETPSDSRQLNDEQIVKIKTLQDEGAVKRGFNWNFLRNADASEPESAGMAASIVGSILTIIVFLLASFPIGVMAAFYLEEFAPKNVMTDIIEVSINNLAAIPSIIFGLLGLVVYLNFMHLPRSSAIVGGLTLSMLVLPVIIIGTRNAIKTIPASIKEAAVAMGASKVQVMFHHTFPLSLPGIMTGTILAISRALGETAPLLMIGMVAFIADVPQNFTDPTTVMPVQIYLWSDSPELGFAEKSAAAIMVLLTFLISFNGIAVYIRKKFEKKW